MSNKSLWKLHLGYITVPVAKGIEYVNMKLYQIEIKHTKFYCRVSPASNEYEIKSR